ncbi:peptide ABC transporter ATP-binding protein [Ochrobactrum sp. 695/2009]|uniref:ABC transporter ATP-binding protein n=1 Tax=Brucella intermedia TaxID=94625 RepID=A0A7V6PE36_9HYPH|nr:ABC transporter ATP-binding protein [Brucella intermedia]PJR92408.1 peptide ABC transporter ATP-binding protein [Ochrobactrum sp. 721/2009]PJT15768.1 peptide ABC transporter ATP-binding protein [Ochrobactrum sp. 720/2009]PJT18372.1 peptide ABC transporter ATP-binding protein [Ochrobactrum sp. 715/2009]PJT24014.1 peptide ABC transporter ATP-binding protein [Ochrobactrum sp. 695/2009]PJT33545.1 peptide ABC transporter ATP-binding protein [Ochrobactrum sp. 689/2009]
MTEDMSTNLLEISNLSLQYSTASGPIPILHNVSTTLGKGEILGIIGESGAGKSTLGNAVIGLLGSRFKQTSGSIRFAGQELAGNTMNPEQARGRRISAVFQDHTASLDPLMSVGAQLDETIRLFHTGLSRLDIRKRGIEILGRVGIPEPERRYNDYPHQFSGGQRQRIVIAIALAGSPEIIIADEPTSALDATVQKQILMLLRRLVDETGVSVMLVTHDMGVIAEIADKVLVMRHGRVVEQNSTRAILDAPQNEYTRKLLAAVPRLRLSGNDSHTKMSGATNMFDKHRTGITPAADILVVNNVSKSFRRAGLRWPFSRTAPQKALDQVSIRLQRGSVTGVVGESGSGKTTMGRIIAGLETASDGEIAINGAKFDVSKKGRTSGILGRVQMVFQDPSVSLNPRMTIGDTLEEAVRSTNRHADRATTKSDAEEMMDRLGLARNFLSRFPHQLSGGQKQRICIARALLARPQIIVADEPTSALDVSVQAEIVSLLKERIAEDDISMIFISHDLAVVQDLCSQIYILRNGRVEDYGPSETVFAQSSNAYTRSLVAARSQRFIQ